MGIGPRVRGWLGRWEAPAADAYRGFFFNIESLARSVAEWAPASRILEIGCGEGALTERLARTYPAALITGIDVTPRIGRLFRGARARVVFFQERIQEFSAAHPVAFDLVLVCDVLHHLPWETHTEFLALAKKTLRPGGRFVLKEWERRPNPVHLLGYLSDRYLTGERIRYGTAGEFRKLIQEVFGQQSLAREIRLPPWRNNVAFFVRP